MKNPQTTIAPTFLTHIISAIDGVHRLVGHKNNISASMAIESFLSHYSAVKSKFY